MCKHGTKNTEKKNVGISFPGKISFIPRVSIPKVAPVSSSCLKKNLTNYRKGVCRVGCLSDLNSHGVISPGDKKRARPNPA